MIPNTNYSQLKESYLFFNIAQKTKAWQDQHSGQRLLRMGIGDVSLPLSPAVISALHGAVEDQAKAGSFHGYMPECGAPFLREAIAAHYQTKGVDIDSEEVFVSSGASDELGDILDLFQRGQTVAIMEPAYPAYVDANLMAGNRILKVEASQEQGFLPLPEEGLEADLIYICSPNNPTGAAYDREQLRKWVDFANQKDAVILFDAAYEAFIEDPEVPHSIFEIEGAKTCAIEICSLSKTAGFTGTRCGYTIIPRELTRGGMNLRQMWIRNRTTKTNGVSYIIQKGAAAVFTPEGQAQIQENLRIYKENAKTLMRALDTTGIWYTGGKNAPYIWMRCPAGMDSWAFFDLLLDRAQIVGTPGEGFGACGRDFFRFSTFSSPQDTAEAAQRLAHLL
ncbi:MAG: LL-diaminopimelate aminotransferase [Clostridia bacterium]|nr:LL-diaminopimelate aminotransferase [Clostridia bacterium]